jgi:hypothetical protein
MPCFLVYSQFVVDYVTRFTYDSGTIQNCAWTLRFDAAGLGVGSSSFFARSAAGG